MASWFFAVSVPSQSPSLKRSTTWLLRLRQALALAGANLVALDADRLHAPRQAVALEERHRHGPDARRGGDPRQHHDEELRLGELHEEEREHRPTERVPLKVEVDHLLHHADADHHPDRADDEGDLAHVRDPKELDVA